MFGWFIKSKQLNEHLGEVKKLKIKGVLFHIRKLQPLDHLNGSRVMNQLYDTYKNNQGSELAEASLKKIMKHQADVFMSAVLKPKLCRSAENQGTDIFVEEIFRDLEMAEELYAAIMMHTYGKKNLKPSI